MGFDLFRLVSYLNLKGILKRVHRYPVYPPNDESRFGSSNSGQTLEEIDDLVRVSGIEIKRSEVYRWFDGHHHFDEICLRCGIQDQMELQKICDKDPEIVVIRR